MFQVNNGNSDPKTGRKKMRKTVNEWRIGECNSLLVCYSISVQVIIFDEKEIVGHRVNMGTMPQNGLPFPIHADANQYNLHLHCGFRLNCCYISSIYTTSSLMMKTYLFVVFSSV